MYENYILLNSVHCVLLCDSFELIFLDNIHGYSKGTIIKYKSLNDFSPAFLKSISNDDYEVLFHLNKLMTTLEKDVVHE